MRGEAIPVYNFTDIVNAYSQYFSNENYVGDYTAKVEKTQHELKEPRKPREKSKQSEGMSEKRKTQLSEELLSSLEPQEAAVLRLLEKSPAKIDELIEKSETDYNSLVEIFTNLEIAGYVERGQDGTYSIV